MSVVLHKLYFSLTYQHSTSWFVSIYVPSDILKPKAVLYGYTIQLKKEQKILNA